MAVPVPPSWPCPEFAEFSELLGWKRPSRSSSPTHALTFHLDHGTKCHIQSFLNTSQDGDSTTSMGRAFQYFVTLSMKNIFLTSNLYLPWRSLRLCPLVVSVLPGERDQPHLTTATFQGAVESDKVTSESPFLQAKQPQLPQPFVTGLMFQAPPQPRCLLWMCSNVTTSSLN